MLLELYEDIIWFPKVRDTCFPKNNLSVADNKRFERILKTCEDRTIYILVAR